MKKIELGCGVKKIRSTFILPKLLDHQLEIQAAVEGRLKSEIVIDAIRDYLRQKWVESKTLPMSGGRGRMIQVD